MLKAEIIGNIGADAEVKEFSMFHSALPTQSIRKTNKVTAPTKHKKRMNIEFVDKRTCVTYPSGELRFDNKIELRKRVKCLFGYKWKVVKRSTYGRYLCIETTINRLIVDYEWERNQKRKLIKYKKLMRKQ